MPGHLIRPELSRENTYSIQLWNQYAATQLRVDFGNIYGLDLAAVATVFKLIEVEDIRWELEKMVLIFNELHGEKTK